MYDDSVCKRIIKLQEAYEIIKYIQSAPYVVRAYGLFYGNGSFDKEIIDIINDASKRASILWNCTTLDIISSDIRKLQSS